MDKYQDLRTPCFVYDAKELHDNINAFQEAMRFAWNGKTAVGLSVKTAPIVEIASFARKLGCMAEVVSDEEFQLALDAGFNAKEIIFNGPIKSRNWLEYALLHEAVVNLDSEREIQYACDFAREHSVVPRVGLRVNFDLEKICPGETIAEDEGSRFGFCLEDGSLRRAIEKLRVNNVEPAGLHVHFSTKTHSPAVYNAIASMLCNIASLFELRSLEYLDLGGGYYGGGTNRSAYGEYVKNIIAGLDRFPGREELTLICEPGGSVLCTAGEYVGKVVDAKSVRGRIFVVTELSKLNLNSTVFSRRAFTCDYYRFKSTSPVPIQTICGYTCVEMDRLQDIENEALLSQGDIVVVRNAGAYTVSFAPGFFIKHSPEIYMREADGAYRQIACGSYHTDSVNPPSM